MDKRLQAMSVKDIAELCGVGRSTVSYWISKKPLTAHRSGNKHLVSIDDLILFLKSEGKPVPQVLIEQMGSVYHQPMRPFKRCWEYWANDFHGTKCQQCPVFTHLIELCFTSKNNQNRQCPIRCHKCQYFGEYFGPRIAFVHQIHKPAAIFKDLYLWSGNRYWAEICGFEVDQLIGAGVEEFIHSDSLKEFIRCTKRQLQGDPAAPDRYPVYFSGKQGKKINICLNIIRMDNPLDTQLAIAEKID